MPRYRPQLKSNQPVLMALSLATERHAKIMLTKAGYRVEMANKGKEAVEKFTANPDEFDLIFMDI